MLRITVELAGTSVPHTTVSANALRAMISSGGSQRMPSSIAAGSSDRSARNAASCSGFESSPNIRLDDDR